MPKWDKLIESYTGHTDVREKVRTFIQLEKYADAILGNYREIGHKVKTLAQTVEDLSRGLEDMRKELRNGGVSPVELEHVDNAQHHLDTITVALGKAHKTITAEFYSAGSIPDEVEEAKKTFIEHAKDGTYTPPNP